MTKFNENITFSDNPELFSKGLIALYEKRRICKVIGIELSIALPKIQTKAWKSKKGWMLKDGYWYHQCKRGDWYLHSQYDLEGNLLYVDKTTKGDKGFGKTLPPWM